PASASGAPDSRHRSPREERARDGRNGCRSLCGAGAIREWDRERARQARHGRAARTTSMRRCFMVHTMLECTKTGSPRPRRMLAGVCCGVALVASSIANGGVWTTHGPDDGRVNAIAVDPTTPTTVYAATDGGGFFKSFDGGDTWSPISTGIWDVASSIMTGIAVDPATPARVYATASFGLNGGIFRSTDAGGSWSFTAFGVLRAVAIDPATPSTVYAVGDGILKSSDAGANWTSVRTGGDLACVAIAPSSPSTVYAGGFDGTLFKSTDAGGTWTLVLSHPTEPI